jgi:hypothetical protein
MNHKVVICCQKWQPCLLNRIVCHVLDCEPYCITVVPCTDKAVVTLPHEFSIQFINTTKNTKDKKIKIGGWCEGITAVKDKIYIGGDYKVVILNTDGSRVREITTDGGYNDNLLYNERNDQLLLRQTGSLCCINLVYKI